MRAGELYGLQRSHIDLDADIPCVMVRQQVRTPRGKGDHAAVATLKSKWSRRTLPLHPKAIEWLTPRCESIKLDAFLFGDGATRPNVSLELREDLEAAGLSKECKGATIVFHSLRHTFATLLGNAEVPGDLVDRMLGQAPATTRGRRSRWWRP